MATQTPLVSISTLTTRPVAEIDGKRYELRTQDEFTFLAIRGHYQDFQRMGQLMDRIGRLTMKEEQDLSRRLEQFCRLILIAPPAVHKKLRDDNRWALVQGFSTLLRPSAPAGASPAPKHRRTGTK